MGRGEEHEGKVGLFYFVSHVLAPAGMLCNHTSGLKECSIHSFFLLIVMLWETSGKVEKQELLR